MKRARTTLDPKRFPAEVAAFFDSADIYDSSCLDEAHVFFIDKDQGYFLKKADAGFLKPEHLMHGYFHSIGLTSQVLLYQTSGGRDYMITVRVPGEDCTHSLYG